MALLAPWVPPPRRPAEGTAYRCPGAWATGSGGEIELGLGDQATRSDGRRTAVQAYPVQVGPDGVGVAEILDARNQVMGVNTVSVGSVAASIVHPRETFKPALLMGASSIILGHNHPSGDPSPSQDDLDLTRRRKQAGEILGIAVLDHLIIAEGRFCSLNERGLL